MYIQNKVIASTFLTRRSRQYGVSAIAMGALLMAMPTFAQTSEGDEDEVVATGIRQSLQNAQDIKRDADTFVDSITADDIGSLPDVSVLEALQRVPGISISRFAAGDDPDHFNVEGSGVVVRGLTYVRSEFNGRDAFTANNGRALGFQDVPPELVGGVDVFKNQTADMIEGGIAGVVNLKTLVPFDRAGNTFVVSAEGTYADLEEEWSPAGSILGTYRWDTAMGEFGVLGNISFSNLKTRSDAVRVAPFYGYTPSDNGFGQITSGFGVNNVGDPNAADNIAAPAGMNIARQQFDRDRLGIALAGQWQSNDGRHLATAQFIRSDASNAWTEHTLQSEEDPGERRSIFSREGSTSPFTGDVHIDRDNPGTRIPVNRLFDNGVISSSQTGWTGRDGIRQTSATRVSDTDTLTSDYSLNYKFTPNDQWKFNFDLQFVDAETQNSDVSAFAGQYVDIAYDLRGDIPTVEYLLNPSRPASIDSFTSPEHIYWRAAMDHFEDSVGEEIAFRGDAEYDFDSDGWFNSVRFGYRFAEREQLTKWSNYNWGNVSEAWNGGIVTAADTPQNFETYTYDNFHRGDVLRGADTFQFVSADLVSDYAALLRALNAGDYSGYGGHLRGERADGLFNPSEISDVTETTNAIYARVDFGQDSVEGLGGMSVEGNYGVRIIQTEIDTSGFVQYQPNSQCDPTASTTVTTSFTVAAAEACATLQTQSGDVSFQNDFVDILPSVNVKLGVTEDVIVRLAASQGIFRPDVGQLRAARNINADFTTDDSGIVVDPVTMTQSGNRIVDLIQLNEQGGNPQLQPTRSNNLDASLEWYFDDVGSVTVSAFYKEISDVIIGTRDLEAGGAGFTSVSGFPFQGAVNNGDGEVSGYEIAYQQFYDELPGWMSGFGIQANYTYIRQEAFPNTSADSNRASGQQDFQDQFTVSDLENLSEHTVNLVGLYENDTIEARLAYNWRSEFLLTTLDVITRLPAYHNDTGQLDASFKYNITDNFQIGIQGVNLTSEVTETELQYDAAGNRQARAFYENDRRFIIQGRYKF